MQCMSIAVCVCVCVCARVCVCVCVFVLVYVQEERLLLEDLVHYMHYAMGIYGWPLHVFDKPCCGICQLCSVTW